MIDMQSKCPLAALEPVQRAELSTAAGIGLQTQNVQTPLAAVIMPLYDQLVPCNASCDRIVIIHDGYGVPRKLLRWLVSRRRPHGSAWPCTYGR